jgi:uncharacterized protein (DUF433 family)
MELPDFLTQSTDGEIRMAGHRIGLYHLVQYYNEGESAEMLASRYPTLPLALVHKVIAFYLDHQPEVDAYIGTCVAALNQQRGEARRLELSALRQRLSTGPQPTTTAQHPV